MPILFQFNLKNTEIYLCVLGVILSSYSVYMVVHPIATIVQIIVMLLISITICMNIHVLRIKQSYLCLAIFVFCAFMGASFISTTSSTATLFRCTRFILMLLFAHFLIKDKRNALYIIYQCLYFLCVIHFLGYIAFEILWPQMALNIISIDIEDLDGMQRYVVYNNHFNIFYRLATTTNLLGFTIKRLTGFSTEAGMYQIYLNYCLAYILFFTQDKAAHFKKISFFIINILLTASTMGLLTMIILLVTKFFNKYEKFIKIIIGIPGIFFTSVFVYRVLLEKSQVAAYSFFNRLSEFDLLYDILFSNNFLGQENIVFNTSNGFIRFLWSYGYIAVFASFLIIYLFFKNSHILNNTEKKLALSLWLFLSLITEPIEYFNFTFLIISIMIVDFIENRKNTSV